MLLQQIETTFDRSMRSNSACNTENPTFDLVLQQYMFDRAKESTIASFNTPNNPCVSFEDFFRPLHYPNTRSYEAFGEKSP